MTADVTTEQLLGELIAVLAGACRDADRDGLRRGNAAVTRAKRHAGIVSLVDDSARMYPLAGRLARSVAARDLAGIRMLLEQHRPEREWRQLAIALAVLADPAQASVSGTRSAA